MVVGNESKISVQISTKLNNMQIHNSIELINNKKLIQVINCNTQYQVITFDGKLDFDKYHHNIGQILLVFN